MTAPLFVDTNVLVYGRDTTEPEKQVRAAEILGLLWETRRGRISTQVLQEFYVTVTRKLRPGLPRSDARRDVEAFLAWDPPPPGPGTFATAWRVEDRWGLSWWDSLVVASAMEQGCALLLSEDLQHGLQIDRLLVQNPFDGSFQLRDLQ